MRRTILPRCPQDVAEWGGKIARQPDAGENVTDLWAVKKVNPQSMIHLTEKPVELKVDRLERALGPPGACGRRTTVLLAYLRGQPRPPIPADAARCRRCGRVHARFHELVVVRTRAEAEAARAQNQREAGP